MNMRFYWINDRIKQGQFRVFWRPGSENLGNYHPKHHPTDHHIAVWSKYLHVPKLSSLQGCVNLTGMVSPTSQQSPALNPTKWEIHRSQLQHYFLECLSLPLRLISAQIIACEQTRVWARTHNLLPSLEPLVTVILHVSSLISNKVFYTDDHRQWR